MDKELLLEKFIQNSLSEVERKELNRLCADDKNFKNEVDFHSNIAPVAESVDDDSFREMFEGFKAEAEDDDTIREMISGFEAEALLELERDDISSDVSFDIDSETKSKNTIVRRLHTKWLVAASIVLIAGLSYFLLPASISSPQELFVQNFEPHPNVLHPIVRGVKGPEPETRAFLAYQNGEYASALALIADLYTETKNPDYLFYQANLLLQLNRAQEAIPLLQLQFSDKLSTKKAWYLAMAYLQVDDLNKAEKMLQTVVEEDEFKVVEAKKLLKSLKKLPPK